MEAGANLMLTVLTRKHAADLGAYLTGRSEDGFYLNPSALDGWAYPLDLDFTLDREDLHYEPKDASGVPMLRYSSVGTRYNPTRVASYGLANYNRLVRTGDEDSRDHFLNVARWFLAAPDGLWQYDFDWNDLRAPWISCMSQGEGISVLVRAYLVTGDEAYLDQSRKALVPLATDLEHGGVRSRLNDGSEFLEEYPSPRPVHVLNGFLYALIGIHDLMRVDANAGNAVGFADLVKSLERNLYRWDLGYWSAYDLSRSAFGQRNAATVAYHKLHITLLTYLGHVLDSRGGKTVAARWTGQCDSFVSRMKALGSKVAYRTAVRTQR